MFAISRTAGAFSRLSSVVMCTASVFSSIPRTGSFRTASLLARFGTAGVLARSSGTAGVLAKSGTAGVLAKSGTAGVLAISCTFVSLVV